MLTFSMTARLLDLLFSLGFVAMDLFFLLSACSLVQVLDLSLCLFRVTFLSSTWFGKLFVSSCSFAEWSVDDFLGLKIKFSPYIFTGWVISPSLKCWKNKNKNPVIFFTKKLFCLSLGPVRDEKKETANVAFNHSGAKNSARSHRTGGP